nr:liver-expressed antimicrobial peptide 2 [Columba livia]
MHWWKVTLVVLLCTLLLSQARAAAVPARAARERRMTPFWRGVSLRPVGASCRDNSECITMLCRKNRCFLRTAAE